MNPRERIQLKKCRLRGAKGQDACPCIGVCKIPGVETEILAAERSVETLRERLARHQNGPIREMLLKKIQNLEQELAKFERQKNANQC